MTREGRPRRGTDCGRAKARKGPYAAAAEGRLISLRQVAERRVEVILGLLEGRIFGLALGSRLPRLRRNAEGASDAGDNGHALNSTLRPSRRRTLAERVIPCVRMTADLMEIRRAGSKRRRVCLMMAGRLAGDKASVLVPSAKTEARGVTPLVSPCTTGAIPQCKFLSTSKRSVTRSSAAR